MSSVHFRLTPEDLEAGNIVNLKLVKLQNVENVNVSVLK